MKQRRGWWMMRVTGRRWRWVCLRQLLPVLVILLLIVPAPAQSINLFELWNCGRCTLYDSNPYNTGDPISAGNGDLPLPHAAPLFGRTHGIGL